MRKATHPFLSRCSVLNCGFFLRPQLRKLQGEVSIYSRAILSFIGIAAHNLWGRKFVNRGGVAKSCKVEFWGHAICNPKRDET